MSRRRFRSAARGNGSGREDGHRQAHDEERGPLHAARQARAVQVPLSASMAWSVSTTFWADSSMSITMASMRATK